MLILKKSVMKVLFLKCAVIVLFSQLVFASGDCEDMFYNGMRSSFPPISKLTLEQVKQAQSEDWNFSKWVGLLEWFCEQLIDVYENEKKWPDNNWHLLLSHVAQLLKEKMPSPNILELTYSKMYEISPEEELPSCFNLIWRDFIWDLGFEKRMKEHPEVFYSILDNFFQITPRAVFNKHALKIASHIPFFFFGVFPEIFQGKYGYRGLLQGPLPSVPLPLFEALFRDLSKERANRAVDYFYNSTQGVVYKKIFKNFFVNLKSYLLQIHLISERVVIGESVKSIFPENFKELSKWPHWVSIAPKEKKQPKAIFYGWLKSAPSHTLDWVVQIVTGLLQGFRSESASSFNKNISIEDLLISKLYAAKFVGEMSKNEDHNFKNLVIDISRMLHHMMPNSDISIIALESKNHIYNFLAYVYSLRVVEELISILEEHAAMDPPRVPSHSFRQKLHAFLDNYYFNSDEFSSPLNFSEWIHKLSSEYHDYEGKAVSQYFKHIEMRFRNLLKIYDAQDKK